MIEVKITKVEDLEIVSRPTDLEGNPAKLESDTLAVVSDNLDVINDGVVEELEEDGVTIYRVLCVVNGVGVANLSVSADGDIGSGVETLEETIQVTVSDLNAKNFGFTVRGVPKQ